MLLGLILAVALVAGSTLSASAIITIGSDDGGQIGPYLAKHRALQEPSELVVVDGICASASTMILGIRPRSRLCVTQGAAFQFHSAWDLGPEGFLSLVAQEIACFGQGSSGCA